MEVVSSKRAKNMDKETIDKIGIPSIVLKENAAEKIFKNIVHKGNNFVFFCGVGNNGGDGLAIARKLFQVNKKVKIYVVGNIDKSSDEFMINYNILKNLGVIIEIVTNITEDLMVNLKCSDLVIDSIMGIGLNRNIQGFLYELIEVINENSNYIVSIDNPTGLNSDTGKEMGTSIKASETFVIEVLKKGYFNLGAKDYLGDINVINIGIPEFIKKGNSENIMVMEREYYRNLIPKRSIYGHKGDYGRVVILAGSIGMTGAAYITTKAAIKTGAGLVSLVVEEDIQPILSSKLIEAMTVNYSEKDKITKLVENANVIICGPGLGRREKNKSMLYRFINESTCPIVLDADGLNLISNDKEILSKLVNRAVFTPHTGEMARLINKEINYINDNRIEVCRDYASSNIVTVLKGFNTVISDGKTTIINNTGNSKMASGGMGDCLTGIIGSLVSQGIGIYESAILGTYIHGALGDKLSESRYVVTAEDMINEIAKFIDDILK